MRLIFLVFLMFSGPSLVRASETTGRLAASFVDGMATLAKRVSGNDVKVTLKTSKTSSGFFKEGFRWGGEGSEAPPNLISSVVIEIGSEKIFVPLSAFSDLGDPRQVSLKNSPAGFEVVIAGGDAGVAYNAVLVFENGWLTRRRVAHGEFPDEAWEETRYAYNTLSN